MRTYTTTKVKFAELTKKVNRIFKKLDAINAEYRFEVVREFVKQVPVYAVVKDEVTRTEYYKHLHDTNVECVEFILELTPYKVGDYRFGAVVERTTDENENLVFTADETVDFTEYKATKIICEHCGTKHNRAKAIVLVNNVDGTHKMVGTACVKDYIGYATETFAKYFREIESIIINNEEPRIYDNEEHLYNPAIDNVKYLASCIKRIEYRGYNKEETKELALDFLKYETIEEKYIERANKVIEFFENYTTTNEFEQNTKMFVTGRSPILRANGFVAYAYELYKKIIEKQRKEAEREKAKELSNYVGEVGKKITAVGTITIAGGYETQFGYTVIYKVTDTNGNTIIWKTGTCLKIYNENGIAKDISEIGQIEITGTVKEHYEYRGEKQTVLTRCKVKECVVA